MTPRERLMAALVASELSYEQLPEDDVARLLFADPTLEEAIDLGTAWQEAVAALPEGWVGPDIEGGGADAYGPANAGEEGLGPTVAASLRALAEALRRRGEPICGACGGLGLVATDNSLDPSCPVCLGRGSAPAEASRIEALLDEEIEERNR